MSMRSPEWAEEERARDPIMAREPRMLLEAEMAWPEGRAKGCVRWLTPPGAPKDPGPDAPVGPDGDWFPSSDGGAPTPPRSPPMCDDWNGDEARWLEYVHDEARRPAAARLL